jgi:ubiquitin-protein ligase
MILICFSPNIIDTIFVRAYEDRMDLLRAVIMGPAGTPYHDGLFFFDIYFPPQYPSTPPVRCFWLSSPILHE